MRNVRVCEFDERIPVAPGDLSGLVGTVPLLFVAVCVRGVTCGAVCRLSLWLVSGAVRMLGNKNAIGRDVQIGRTSRLRLPTSTP